MRKASVEKNSSQDSNESSGRKSNDISFLQFVAAQFRNPRGIYQAAVERAAIRQQRNEEKAKGISTINSKIWMCHQPSAVALGLVPIYFCIYKLKFAEKAERKSNDITFLQFVAEQFRNPRGIYQAAVKRAALRRQRKEEKTRNASQR